MKSVVGRSILFIFFSILFLISFQNCGDIKLLLEKNDLASTSCEENLYSILSSWDSANNAVKFYLQETTQSDSHEYTGSIAWKLNDVLSEPILDVGATPSCTQNVKVIANFANNCGANVERRSDFLDPRCEQATPTPTPTSTPVITPTPTPTCTTTANRIIPWIDTYVGAAPPPGESVAVSMSMTSPAVTLPNVGMVTLGYSTFSVVEQVNNSGADVQFAVSHCPGDFSSTVGACSQHTQYTGGGLRFSIGPKRASIPWYMPICELPAGTTTVYFNLRQIERPTPNPPNAPGIPSCPQGNCGVWVNFN